MQHLALDWRGPVRPSMTGQHLTLTWQCGGTLGTRLAWTSSTWHGLAASGTEPGSATAWTRRHLALAWRGPVRRSTYNDLAASGTDFAGGGIDLAALGTRLA